MSDAAFKSAPFAGHTSAELQAAVNRGDDPHLLMRFEIARREKVAAGDVSVMTPGERLRHARQAT